MYYVANVLAKPNHANTIIIGARLADVNDGIIHTKMHDTQITETEIDRDRRRKKKNERRGTRNMMI